MIEIDTNKVYSLRPNEYDAGVLESISKSHPEIPDVAGLIRKALREYQIARYDGGGTKVQVSGMAKLLEKLIVMVNAMMGDLNYVKARIDKCESLGD